MKKLTSLKDLEHLEVAAHNKIRTAHTKSEVLEGLRQDEAVDRKEMALLKKYGQGPHMRSHGEGTTYGER